MHDSLVKYLVNVHALSPQVGPRQVDFLHELCMGFGDIVECKDTEAEFEEEVGAEGDEGPEW